MLLLATCLLVVCSLLVYLVMRLKGDVTAVVKVPLVTLSLDAKDKKQRRARRPQADRVQP